MLDSCEALIIRISLPGSSPGELTYMAHRYQTLLALITVPNLYNKNKYTHRYSYIRYSLSFIRELSAHSRLFRELHTSRRVLGPELTLLIISHHHTPTYLLYNIQQRYTLILHSAIVLKYTPLQMDF